MVHRSIQQYLPVLALTLLALALPGRVAAQDGGFVTGTLLDGYGQPVRAAAVVVKGSTDTTYTGLSGEFKVKAGPQQTIILQHDGYNAITHKVTGATQDIRLRMEESYLQFPKRIPVLYGEAAPATMVGSVASVYTNQLSTTPATLYAYALSGRLPGLYTYQTSGFRNPATGNNYDVNIFLGNIPHSGAGETSDNTEIGLSLRGNSPVTIIDGVQRDVYSIDPENIESISVLKDAMSTILLGQRSSRGVLLITTKRARAGKPRLSFTAQTGIQEAISLPKPLPAWQYAYLLNEALQNDGKDALYTESDIKAYRDHTDPYGHPDVNWYNTILRKTAPISDYNLAINGGGNVARYAVALNYTDQKGLFRESNTESYNTNAELKRYLINADVNVDVTRNLNVGLQIFGRIQDGWQPGAGMANILGSLLNTPNNAYPIKNPNGTWGGTGNLTANLLSQTINSGYIQDQSKDVMSNVDIRYDLSKLLPGLAFVGKGNLSIQSQNALIRNKSDLVYHMGIDQGDTIYTKAGTGNSQSNSFAPVFNSQNFFGQLSFQYDHSFGRSNVTGGLYVDRRQTIYNYDLPGVATNLSAKGGYNYAGRYFLEAAVNRSGYNRYMPGHQYGTFYAFGAGWDLAREGFLQDASNWLDQLKIRGVYGRTGNGIDNSGYYIWRQDFSEDNGIGGGIYAQGTVRSPSSGVRENGLANVNISWETGSKTDVGFDAAFFKNKLVITGDYYHDVYANLLQTRGKSIALIGAAYPAENIGRNLYQGGELQVTYNGRAGAFNYFITGNANLFATKVLYMDEQRRDYSWNRRTGQPVGMPFGYIAEGLFQTADEANGSATIAGYKPLAGDIHYKDLNGDGEINQFDEAPIGTYKPTFYYGLTAGFSYKGIEFSALLQGVSNRDEYVANFATEGGFQFNNFTYGQAYQQITGRWTPETALTATYPRLTADANYGYNKASSTFWMHNGNYFRLKNVSLAYNLPYAWTSRLKIGSARIFVNGLNLFTHAAYDFVDPEVGVGAYPIQRVVNTGINVKF